MKFTINEKKENILLGRQEVSGSVEFEAATPSNNEIAEKVATELKVKPELVVMKSIYNKFGLRNADFVAFVYKSAEEKSKAEMTTKHMKKQAEADKKAKEEANKAEEAAKEAEAKEEPATVEEEPAKDVDPVGKDAEGSD
jgi:ribosomal protein S24E